MRRALKVKQDVFSGRRPFQSRQIPDNLSKFPPLISASNNSALFVPPTVCSKVGNRRRGNLGHSSPRCEQSIPSNSAIPKISSSTSPPRSESDRTPGSGCSGGRNLRRQCRCQGCIIRSILPSGMGARGVSSEHVENMEMFSCSPT